MYQDSPTQDPKVLKENLAELIQSGISSIDAMSDELGTSDETVVDLLKQLIDDGRIEGYISGDETRFFRSDVKTSDKPLQEYSPEKDVLRADRGVAAYVPIAGIITFIVGQVINQSMGDVIGFNITEGIVMGGLLITIMGLVYLTMIDQQKGKET